jgi:hypothetical protein
VKEGRSVTRRRRKHGEIVDFVPPKINDPVLPPRSARRHAVVLQFCGVQSGRVISVAGVVPEPSRLTLWIDTG